MQHKICIFVENTTELFVLLSFMIKLLSEYLYIKVGAIIVNGNPRQYV